MPERLYPPVGNFGFGLRGCSLFVRLLIDGDWQGGEGEHHLHAGQGDEEREAPGGRQAEDGGGRIFKVKRQSHEIPGHLLANKTIL